MKFKFLCKGLVVVTLSVAFFAAYFFLEDLSNIIILLIGNDVEHVYDLTMNRSVPSCMIILRERSGRLGNRLFMFASAFGIGLTHSCSLKMSSKIIRELTATFSLNLTQLRLNQSDSNESSVIRPIYNHCSFIPDLFFSNTFRNIELTGYWQVYNYFINHSTFIRQQLRFKPSILDRVHNFFTTLPTNLTRIGIHIRRGDFLQVRKVSSDDYILTAMTYFTEKYRSVLFIIVTDDRYYCQKVFGYKLNVFFTPSSFDASTDLATLTECNHLIITVGTFGWWAAFLIQNPLISEVIVDIDENFNPIDNNCTPNVYFPPSFSFLKRIK